MASLGSFGRRYDPVVLDFQFFEHTIRVNPRINDAALVEFLAEAGTVDQADEVRGAQLIMRYLRNCIHPDDFAIFWETAKRERQSPATDLMPIAQAITEAVAGFPTGPSSASSPGPQNTPARSVVDLPSTVLSAPNLTPAPESTAARAMAHLHGRPDLQEFVVMTQEELAKNHATIQA